MILVDANNLAYIAYYSLGELSEGEVRTGTIFGFLNLVNSIAKKFGTKFVFLFDSKKNKRKDYCTFYKANRHTDLTEDQKIELHQMHLQITKLRKEILPAMGFRNSKVKPGYEADDLIAHYVAKYSYKKRITIVSTDQDLYQLLGDNVRIYNPRTKKTFTAGEFSQKFGIDPMDWPEVKAIAGDSSDNIAGVPKVGIKTAIKYLNGNLSTKTVAYENIKKEWDVVLINRKLVHLPYMGGTDIMFNYKPNRLTRKKFIEVFDNLRFVHYLKEEQFAKWEDNFKLTKVKGKRNVGRKRIFRTDNKERGSKKSLRKLSRKRKKANV